MPRELTEQRLWLSSPPGIMATEAFTRIVASCNSNYFGQMEIAFALINDLNQLSEVRSSMGEPHHSDTQRL